ncbi:MAG TPA: amidohydrolase family protein [Polyangia bacterium]|nr:amidohydrolase family protein [Polyangia bacterium]
MKKSWRDDEPSSPIPFWTGSNGEYDPPPPSGRDRRAAALLRRLSTEQARRLGVSRRQFLESSCGAAAALLVINQVYGCGSDNGGHYNVDASMTSDSAAACDRLSGSEFIFDVQTHHINPNGAWRQISPQYASFFQSLPQASCGEMDKLVCFDARHYIREEFVNSDTAVAVLSAVPADPNGNPLTADEQVATRELVNMLAQSQRLLVHGLVLPDRGQAQLDGMQNLAESLKIAAWKIYTPFGGWRLDDPAIGIPFIERARQLGIKLICAHKGLPLAGFDPNFASPADIGVVAAMYPDVKFLVYHSGFETTVTEGPYNPQNPQGVDRLVKTCLDHGIGPGGNVYGELGSTWRYVMTRPDQAAHVLGKLLKVLGEDRIVWGTDSIWYGSPQDQIMAFRTFEIPAAMQAQYGYPALTPTARAKIFGLNAAAAYGVDPAAVRCAIHNDQLSQLKLAARERPLGRGPALGPRTRREFLRLLRMTGGHPG